MFDGCEVEVCVEVFIVVNEFLVVKCIIFGIDLSFVDKFVLFVLIDGCIYNYEVENWEILLEDKEKLFILGVYIQMIS